MRAPAFWWKPGRGRLLLPIAAIYGAIAARRMRAAGQSAGLPVICLGNFTVGGAGKTPAALAVARILRAGGQRPVFLSRGYGGELAGPVVVDVDRHKAAEVGDEPLLLAQVAPTVVARDRIAGAATARNAGATIIVMDDGFQNPSLRKDLSIIAVDARRGLGNGRVLPAGPLRAPLDVQLAQASALIVVGDGSAAAALEQTAAAQGLPVFHAHLEADADAIAALAGNQVLAFAGIADPDKFFTTLAQAGIGVTERASFPDHHRFTATDARALLARAQAQTLRLVTTEKDLVRLSGDPRLAALAAATTALPVRLIVAEDDAFRAMLMRSLAGYALRE